MSHPIPPIIRSIEEAFVDVARIELGVIVVADQVRLENTSRFDKTINDKMPYENDTKYEGVIEVNHDENEADQTENSSEPAFKQNTSLRQVNNHYLVGPEPIPLELANPYPNESPLLAPN